MPRHQVDLPCPVARAEIPRHHGAAIPPQKTMRQIFAKAAMIVRVPAAANPVR
jgi:hypothetical protein